MQTLSLVWAWVHANWAAIGSLAAILIYVWQSQPAAFREHFEKQYPRLVGLIRFAIAMFPAARDAYLAVKHQIVLGQPKSEVLKTDPSVLKTPYRTSADEKTPTSADPKGPTPPAKSGHITAQTLLFFTVGGALCFAAAAVLQACPRYPREACGTPRAFACTAAGEPQVCSPSGQWTVIGDQPCSAQGAQCLIDDAGTAVCAPVGAR